MILVLALAFGGAWVAPVLVAGPAMAQRTVTRSERTVEVRGEFYYIHQVKKKETLYAIARAYGADIEAIRRVNGLQTDQLKKKQRLLIARAVYKDPEFLFFDEATNALDANNEKIIMDNLTEFYKGKTTVIVAHRLSTVQNADNIVVLEKGRIIEQGTHRELTEKRGAYYTLVRNQLELGM